MNKTPPKLSVIIPAYNVSKYISDCLEPILGFNDIDIEIVVVNDGSSDSTSEVLKKYSDKRLKVIHHEKNLGLPEARNTGFKASSGDYVIPLDSDDIPVPGSWKLLLDAVEHNPNAVLAYGYLQPFRDGSTFNPSLGLKPKKPSGDVLSKIVLENGFISIGTAVINRRSIEKVGLWNSSLTIGEDWEMWCRLAAEGEFIYSPILAVGYRQRKSSMTKSKNYMDFEKMSMPVKIIFEHLNANKKIEGQYQNLKKTAFSNFHYRYGVKSFFFKDYKSAVKHIFISFRLRPIKILYFFKYPVRFLRKSLASSAL